MKGWTQLSKFEKKGDHPSKIKFPDGTEDSVKSWKYLIVKAAAWLATSGRLTTDNTPVPLSKQQGRCQYLVSTERKHSTGRSFTAPKQVAETPFWVETNFGGDDALKKTKFLLEYCGVDLERVQVWEGP